MKKIDLGQAMTILANLGVLVGILLLVFELNQNRQMMRAQTRTDLARISFDSLYLVSADPEIGQLYNRGSDGEELSEDEFRRYFRIIVARIRTHENIHYQYRQGMYDESEFIAHRGGWRVFYAAKGIRDAYCVNHENWSAEFAAEVDGLLDEPCP